MSVRDKNALCQWKTTSTLGLIGKIPNTRVFSGKLGTSTGSHIRTTLLSVWREGELWCCLSLANTSLWTLLACRQKATTGSSDDDDKDDGMSRTTDGSITICVVMWMKPESNRREPNAYGMCTVRSPQTNCFLVLWLSSSCSVRLLLWQTLMSSFSHAKNVEEGVRNAASTSYVRAICSSLRCPSQNSRYKRPTLQGMYEGSQTIGIEVMVLSKIWIKQNFVQSNDCQTVFFSNVDWYFLQLNNSFWCWMQSFTTTKYFCFKVFWPNNPFVKACP